MAEIAIPAFGALVFKFILLVYAWYSPRRGTVTRVFTIFLLLLSAYNVVEFLGLSYFAAHGLDHTMEQYGYIYFASVILYTAAMVHVSLRFSIDRLEGMRYVVPLLYVPAAILEYLLLARHDLVAGFQLFRGYTVLRIPGPLYFLFESYMLVYVFATFAYLIYGARGSRPSLINRVRNRLCLFGLLPFVMLHAYLIIANHFGLAKISSTIFVPIAMTFFLIVATYAIYEYRVFDIEFFIPWSKVRKRKTAFYGRIQATIAEIASLRSVREVVDRLANTLSCQVGLIGGLRPVLALVDGQQVEPGLRLSEFPPEALQQVERITVANEIAESRPDLYAVMKRFRVDAIVPFAAHSGTSGNWMLLGEHFSDNVYTPLDFKLVERLFARIAELFVDDLLLVRAQLADARDEIRQYQERLALSWAQLDEQRRRTTTLECEVRDLRAETVQMRRELLHIVPGGLARNLPPDVVTGKVSMQTYLEQCEADMVREALRATHGNRRKAARLLGVADLRALHYIMQRYCIDAGEYA